MTNSEKIAESETKYQKMCELKNNCVNKFNSICIGIGKHLLSDFPENKDLNMYNRALSDIVKINPLRIIKTFKTNIYENKKYKESILTSDEHFFASNNLKDLTEDDKDNLDMMFQFKSCWSKMSDASKTFVKMSMKQLIKMCEHYIIFSGDCIELEKELKKN